MKRAWILVLGVLLAACSKKPSVPPGSGNPVVNVPPVEKRVLWVGEIPRHYKNESGYGLWSQIYSELRNNAVASDEDPAQPHDATLTVACSERVCGKFDNGDDAWTFTLRFTVTPKGASAPTLDFTIEAGSLEMEFVSRKLPVRVVAMSHLMDDPRTKIAPALVAAALGATAAVPGVLKGCLRSATRGISVAALRAGGWTPATAAEKAAWAIGTDDRAGVVAAGDAAVDAAMTVLGSFPDSQDVVLLTPILAAIRSPHAGEAQIRILTAMLDRKILASPAEAALDLIGALEADGSVEALPTLDRIASGDLSSAPSAFKAPEVRASAAKAASAIRARPGGR